MRSAPALLTTCAILAVGCASIGAERARERALARELDGWRDPRPLDDVWQDVRRLLSERGYPLARRDADAVGKDPDSGLLGILPTARNTVETRGGGRALETGWTRSRDRYRAEALVDARGSRVVFTHFTDLTSDRQVVATRDLELELALLRRSDPAAAERIEAAAAGGR